MSKLRSALAKLAMLAAAVLMAGAFAGASPALAAKHPTVQSQIQHYLMCLDLMLNNPAKHATECGPGHEFFLPPPNNFTSCPAPKKWEHDTDFVLGDDSDWILQVHDHGDYNNDPCRHHHRRHHRCDVVDGSYAMPLDGAAILLAGYSCENNCDRASYSMPLSELPALTQVTLCEESYRGEDATETVLLNA